VGGKKPYLTCGVAPDLCRLQASATVFQRALALKGGKKIALWTDRSRERRDRHLERESSKQSLKSVEKETMRYEMVFDSF
jgi:hypothetical protein|tara:strand:- start:1417 stop:1656 length:240 start_codon:yes stop_codon:yes gene_type:complete